MGVLLSAFFWVYAPALPLAGWMAHRFDVRVVLAGRLALWSVATVLTGFATGFTTLLIARLLLGLGESAAFPCSIRLMAGARPPPIAVSRQRRPGRQAPRASAAAICVVG